MRPGIVTCQPAGMDQGPDLVEDVGCAGGLEEARLQIDDLVPPPSAVKAQPPAGLERKLHLVPEVPGLLVRDDRTERHVLDTAEMPQALGDDGLLRAQLGRVIEMLPQTSPAGAEVRAPRCDAVGRRLDDADRLGFGERLLHIDQPGAPQVAGRSIGREDDEAVNPSDAAAAVAHAVDAHVHFVASVKDHGVIVS